KMLEPNWEDVDANGCDEVLTRNEGDEPNGCDEELTPNGCDWGFLGALELNGEDVDAPNGCDEELVP
ncbi:hypothetical protein L195_g064761, partial [Trifolium pratense]